MTELRAISKAAAELRARGEPFFVATVVAVHGSSYRRPGARMLVTSDRWIAGCVSGGCIEGDILKRGWWYTGRAAAALVKYDSSADDQDPGWGVGLGCNGVVEILLERVDSPARDGTASGSACGTGVDSLLNVDLERGVPFAIVTVFRSALADLPVGDRILMEAGSPEGAAPVPPPLERTTDGARARQLLRSVARQHLEKLLSSGPHRSSVQTIALTVGGMVVEALLELVVAPPHLFVCGTGRDSLPVVSLARQLGWEVTVHDPRRRQTETGSSALPPSVGGAVPRANRLTRDVAQLQADVAAAGARALVVLMSHDYDADRSLLGALAQGPARYIGVLGPRRRTEKMMTELEIAGTMIDEDAKRRIFTPVGLAIGAETPEEIALAILAEAQATLKGANGGRLRDQPGAIHAPNLGTAPPLQPALDHGRAMAAE